MHTAANSSTVGGSGRTGGGRAFRLLAVRSRRTCGQPSFPSLAFCPSLRSAPPLVCCFSLFFFSRHTTSTRFDFPSTARHREFDTATLRASKKKKKKVHERRNCERGKKRIRIERPFSTPLITPLRPLSLQRVRCHALYFGTRHFVPAVAVCLTSHCSSHCVTRSAFAALPPL